MLSPDRVAVIVGAVLAVLLQLVLAPYLRLFGAMPNFVIVYTMIVAVSRPQAFGPAMPFVLGLVFDLACGGPVGAMAFSLTLFSYLASKVFSVVDNDTLFMPIAVMGLGMLLTELSYGIFLLLFGYAADLVAAIGYRVLPCFVFDLVIGVILYLLTTRLFRQSGAGHHDVISLR